MKEYLFAELQSGEIYLPPQFVLFIYLFVLRFLVTQLKTFVGFLFCFCRWLLLFLLAMISPSEDLCLRFHIFTSLLNMVGYINDMSC